MSEFFAQEKASFAPGHPKSEQNNWLWIVLARNAMRRFGV
jgi:hypothetical protein